MTDPTIELDPETAERLGRAEDQCDLCNTIGTDKIDARGTKSVWVNTTDAKGKPLRVRHETPMRVCRNVDQCHENLSVLLHQDEKLAKMLDSGHVPNRMLDRAYRPRKRSDAIMTKATKTRNRVTPNAKEPGVCQFSGEATKPGSKFRPGYDAKLKSALGKLAKDGDVEAQMEIDVRFWPAKKGTPDEIINKAADELAKIGDKDKRQAWLDRRVKTRLAAIAKGVDPAEAVAGKRTPSKTKAKTA